MKKIISCILIFLIFCGLLCACNEKSISKTKDDVPGTEHDKNISVYIEYNVSPEAADVHRVSMLNNEKIIALDAGFDKCWVTSIGEEFNWQLQEGWALNTLGIDYIEKACMLDEKLMLAWAYIDEQSNVIVLKQDGSWEFFADDELINRLNSSVFSEVISINLLDNEHVLLHYKETASSYAEVIRVYRFNVNNSSIEAELVFNISQNGIQDVLLHKNEIYSLDSFGEIYSASLESKNEPPKHYTRVSDLNGIGLRLSSFNDELYYIGKNGIEYCNEEGGKEKLFDGLGRSFSKATSTINNFLFLDDGGIIVSTIDTNGQIFLYNEEEKTAEDKTLSIFCITDKSKVISAANIFAVQNPNVHLEYERVDWADFAEKGMAYFDDLIKTLNVQIAAGQGPDIFVLDFLPLESYKKQDIFMNLSNLVDTSDIYSEYLAPFEENNSIYMFPTGASFYILTKQDELNKNITFEDMASYVMQYNNKEIPLFFTFNKQDIEPALRGSSLPGFIKGNEVQKNTVESYYSFLDEAFKKVSVMDINSAHPDSRGVLKEIDKYMLYPSYDVSCYYTMRGEAEFGATLLSSIDELVFFQQPELFYDYAVGLNAVEAMPFPGLTKGAWYPEGIMAINAACKEPELAAEFIQCMLVPEIQGEIKNGYVEKGLPVTKTGSKMQFEQIEKLLNNNSQNNEAIMLKDTYTALVEQIDKPIFVDLVLEEILSELAAGILNESINFAETPELFESKVKMYLLEKE